MRTPITMRPTGMESFDPREPDDVDKILTAIGWSMLLTFSAFWRSLDCFIPLAGFRGTKRIARSTRGGRHPSSAKKGSVLVVFVGCVLARTCVWIDSQRRMRSTHSMLVTTRMMRLTTPSLVLIASLLTSGCADSPPDLTECVDFDYREYCQRYGTRGFDPVGARSITYGSYSTRDGYDEWWKLAISRQDWLGLVGQLGLPGPKSVSSQPSSDAAPGIHDSWPSPEKPAPQWWHPPPGYGSSVVASHTQEQAGHRAKG